MDNENILEFTISKSGRPCDYGCGLTGIPILPLVFSQEEYKISTNDARYFKSPKLIAESKTHNAVASLPINVYVYVYRIDRYQQKYLDEYTTGQDGALRKIRRYYSEDLEDNGAQDKQNKIALRNIDEISSENDNNSQPFNCTAEAHSTLDSKYLTFYTDEIAWLMISHAKLSRAVLKKYNDNEVLRNLRMQKFVANNLFTNINTAIMIEMMPEVKYIDSFHQRQQLAKGVDINDHIVVSERVGVDNVSGSSKAAISLHQSMQRAINESDIEESDKLSISPMVVALSDPVGEVIAAAEKRNYLINKLNNLSENEQELRKIINALIIKNLEKASIRTTEFDEKAFFKTGNESIWGTALNNLFSDTDPDDLIFKHIDKGTYQRYSQLSASITELKKQIVDARKNYIKAVTSEEFTLVLKNDFDIELSHSDQTAKDFELMIARCLAGCGLDDSNLGIPQSMLDAFSDTAPISNDAINNEFKNVLLPLLDGTLGVNDNWLLKALGGLDKDLTKILIEFSKKDRASEAVGAGVGYLKETINDATLNRIEVNAKRSALANKDALIKTLSHNLLNLSVNDQKAFRNLHSILEASIYGHTGTIVIPKKVTATVDRMTAFANLAMGIALPKSLQNKINVKTGQAKRGLTNIIESATGTQIVRTPNINTLNQAEEYIIYYFAEASAKNKGIDAFKSINNGDTIDLRQFDADELSKIARQWHANINKGVSIGTGALSGAIAFFQLKAVIACTPQIAKLKYAGSQLALTEIQLGTISSGLALVTASMDVTATGAGLVSKSSFANKLIYRAGWIGVVGAVFEVGSLAIYGYRKYNDGNKGSSYLTIGSGSSVIASSVAGLLYGYGLVSTSTGGLATIPGAVLLGVMLVGLALSYTFQRLAFKFDDKQNTLIEYWLDNGVFGRQAMRGERYSLINPYQPYPAFNNLNADISGYITACSGFMSNSTLRKVMGIRGRSSNGLAIRKRGIEFRTQVMLGNFSDNSELDISIELMTTDKRKLNNIFNLSLLSSNDELLLTGYGSHYDSKRIAIEGKDENNETILTVESIIIKDSSFSTQDIENGRVIIKYLADSTLNPSYPLYDYAYLGNNKY